MNCDGCTLCCTLCEVQDITKPAGTPCEFCTSTCSIYNERPQGCKDFTCAYAQMDKVNTAMRPDKCGVVFEKINDKKVLGMIDPTKKEYPHAQEQITLFKESGYEVILILNNKKVDVWPLQHTIAI